MLCCTGSWRPENTLMIKSDNDRQGGIALSRTHDNEHSWCWPHCDEEDNGSCDNASSHTGQSDRTCGMLAAK